MNMWNEIKSVMQEWFLNVEVWKLLGITLFKVFLIILVAKIMVRMLQFSIRKVIVGKEVRQLHIDARRSKTLGKLMNNVITYAIYFLMFFMILHQLGVQIAPLLAGAGVVGIAIGFGAQSLVRDVLTGFFIIFEDQFGVGDVIQTGNFKGTVEEIGLRVTTIKSVSGEVHIIPNGSILQVTNFSIHNTISTIDIPLDSTTDHEKALHAIETAVQRIYPTLENLVKVPEVLGVQTVNAGEIVVRIQFEALPNTQFQIMRQLNSEIKKELDAHQIALANGAKK
jgi:small-conductance mechanosensitive channel